MVSGAFYHAGGIAPRLLRTKAFCLASPGLMQVELEGHSLRALEQYPVQIVGVRAVRPLPPIVFCRLITKAWGVYWSKVVSHVQYLQLKWIQVKLWDLTSFTLKCYFIVSLSETRQTGGLLANAYTPPLLAHHLVRPETRPFTRMAY